MQEQVVFLDSAPVLFLQLTILAQAVYLILLQFFGQIKTLQKERIITMPKSEAEVKEEITNLRINFKRMRWEGICLLILSLLPSGKFASKMFIYNKMVAWYFLKPDNKNHLRAISRNLCSLYQKKLVIRKDLSILDVWEFKSFCAKNKEGEITERPFKRRTRFIFRLPIEGEKVRINKILLKEVVRRMPSRNSP